MNLHKIALFSLALISTAISAGANAQSSAGRLREPEVVFETQNNQWVTVPVFIARRVFGHGRIDISRMIDMKKFEGFRIELIEVTANSLAMGPAAILDILLDNTPAGAPVFLNTFPQVYFIQPGTAIIGRNVRSIVLQHRGDMDIREVRLRLIGP